MGARDLLDELPDEKSESRLTARVPARVKETIKMAAELSGSTENQFIAQAAYHAARQIIEQEQIVRLSKADTITFLDMLDNPPAPNKKLKSAIAAYRKSGLNVKNRTPR